MPFSDAYTDSLSADMFTICLSYPLFSWIEKSKPHAALALQFQRWNRACWYDADEVLTTVTLTLCFANAAGITQKIATLIEKQIFTNPKLNGICLRSRESRI